MSNLFRLLPSVDFILNELDKEPDIKALPRPLTRNLAGEFLDRLRQAIKDGSLTAPEELDWNALSPRLCRFVRAKARPHFRRVLNATGVVVHTNLGRSLLAKSAVRAVIEACGRYSNLEFELETGKRGSRYSHVEQILCQLTGAEAALVVNNNASAVLITLDTLCKGKEVVVSRGQLVEIGGSFRIPEVMTKSGAILREVGATNRTHPHDYERAIGPDTAALLKVHTSNYRIIGFHSEVALPDLAAIAARHKLPVIEDLGSGSLMDLSPWGLRFEPTVQKTVADGADVVSFSGDKMLGGPQAGIIVGRKEYIARIKKNPMNRAMRIDKMTLAALEATLRLYLEPETARREVPTLAMITATPGDLKAKAGRLARVLRREIGALSEIWTTPGFSRVGGGAYPEQDLETTLIALRPKSGLTVDALKERLLETDPPLVGRIEADAFCLDPRTIAEDEFRLCAKVLSQALQG